MRTLPSHQPSARVRPCAHMWHVAVMPLVVVLLAAGRLFAQPVPGDLRIGLVLATPAAVESGGLVTLTIDVSSNGPKNAQLLWIQARPQTTPPASFVRRSFTNEILAQGAARSYTLTIPMPTIPPGASQSFGIQVQLQEAANITTGNDRTNAAFVTVNPPLRPDLTLRTPAGWDGPVIASSTVDATSTPAIIPSGVPTYLSYSVNNIGGPTPAGVPVRATLVRLSNGQQTDIPVPTPLAPMAANSVSLQRNITIPASALSGGGDFRIIVVLDADGLVAELNESNNSAERQFFIQPPTVCPTIQTQPASQSACPNGDAPFSIQAIGTPAPTFEWQIEDPSGVWNVLSTNPVALPGGGSAFAAPANAPSASIGVRDRLGTFNVRCRASNACGSTTSNPAGLMIQAAPVITTQPLGTSLCAGDFYTISLAASGSLPLMFQWSKNGLPIAGATASSLRIGPVGGADTGTYICAVSNACGTASSNPAVISVGIGPTIASPPHDQRASLGRSVTFGVIANGSDPLSFAWLKDLIPLRDGGAISGANTPTLTINPVSRTDEGRFSVRVSNSCGTITSDPAELVVCIADLDDGTGTGHPDGGVTVEDLLYYLVGFAEGLERADVDDGSGTGAPDGGVTIEDLLYFMSRFVAGC